VSKAIILYAYMGLLFLCFLGSQSEQNCKWTCTTTQKAAQMKWRLI